jgi:hypothetical protein
MAREPRRGGGQSGAADASPIQPKAGAQQVDVAAQVRAERAVIDRRRSKEAAAVATIGPSLARYEAREKVTGATRYAGDVRPANLAHAVVIHSPVARAGSPAWTRRRRAACRA